MNKSELIQRLVDANRHLYRQDVEIVVDTFFDEIAAALSRGDRIELRGFGAFSVRKRDAHPGRNPQTGDSVAITEKYFPFFRTGKMLRDRLKPI